jgi:hypothetical protein
MVQILEGQMAELNGMYFDLTIDDTDITELFYRALEQGCVPDPSLIECVNSGEMEFHSSGQTGMVKVIARSVKSFGFPLGARESTVIKKAACEKLGPGSPAVLIYLLTALDQCDKLGFEPSDWFYMPMPKRVTMKSNSLFITETFQIFCEDADYYDSLDILDAYEYLPGDKTALLAGLHFGKKWFHPEDVFFFVLNQ